MGRVARIGVKAKTPSEHGLPKPSVPSAMVTKAGLEGDFNVYRHEELADDPDSAVLLLPMETIHALRDEGWPVQPGDFGENLTTEGIGYGELAPGTRVRAGAVGLVVTRACDPCTNLYLLPYVGEARGPEFLKVTLGRRGWYAQVSQPGVVRVGDPIHVG